MKRAILAIAAIVGLAVSAAAQDRPNIVFMLVDNFGYGDLGSYGGGVLRGATTPKLDRLAAEGLRLTNFNVEPECTPTRSALMTGRMPIRSGTSSVPLPGHPQGIVPWEYTIAELLSDAGYISAHYGKWHLGDREGRYPTDQGFDEWWGFPHSSAETLNNIQRGYSPDLAPQQQVLEGRKGKRSTVVRPYNYALRPLMDAMITDRAVRYVRAHAGDKQPFFLYIPFSLPHTPPLPDPKHADPARTDYANVLADIDRNAGRVIDAIDTAGIAENTIVVFASDNGPETLQGPGIKYGAQSDSGPFRGEFPSGWEGAIRVPAIIRWPGKVPAGKVSNEIVSILDFYRTFANIAGATDRVPTDRPIDGVDQTAFFLGQQENSNREHVMFFHGSDLLSIKWRKFKIHFNIRETSTGSVRMPGQQMLTSRRVVPNFPWIFDIESDPKEQWNIAPASNWVGVPAAKIIAKYEKSIAEFPNIKPGSNSSEAEK